MAWFAKAGVPWWYAGGWALDMWLGEQTRPHSDLEISCLRENLLPLLVDFDDWEIVQAHNKQLSPLNLAASLPDEPFSVWMRPRNSRLWALEILPEEHDGADWVYRRDARIRRALAEIVLELSDGRRIVAPEIQLLYKSKAPRPKDEVDFTRVCRELGPKQRDWLHGALKTVAPDHAWLRRLR